MSEPELFRHTGDSSGRAGVRIDAKVRGAAPVPPFLLGKFCEHLGSNIYHGMEAQILRNPTFARWRFGAGESHVDGGVQWEPRAERIAQIISERARRMGLPNGEALQQAWQDGGAFWWQRIGAREAVRLSPDAGPHGGRTQRMEILSSGRAGLGQCIYLPLHRTRGYQFRVVARAFEPVEAELSIARAADGVPLASAKLKLERDWRTLTGKLVLPAEAPPDALYLLSVITRQPANVVLGRVLLYPDDHIGFSDADVIGFLRESKLPLLRWPGGNFVSGYRWRDGIGPVDARPTAPNPAWEGLEYNLFGTAEFIAFCRAVGCEPMICVNGGDGTPEEAAAWVQYCNGGAATPMGRLRAEHGHAEPFGVRWWEIGNELYGKWQVGWTTAGGYLDRYIRFRDAMRAADPTIELLANGDAMAPESEWNQALIAYSKDQTLCLADHILTGGEVDGATNPHELFHAFMGLSGVLGGWYRGLCARMRAAGVGKGTLAITELQLFASFRGEPGPKLTRETMPSQDSISEALFFATVFHECARLSPRVDMITHSATVNHGGGLRKARERVWANPVHYAHQMAAVLAGGTPLCVEVSCPGYSTSRSFKHIPPLRDVPVLDALAVEKGTEIVVSLVHRGAACGPLEIELACEGLSGKAEALQLSGETWCERNTLEDPERVVPRAVKVATGRGGVCFAAPPFSLTVLRLKRAE